MVEKTPYLDHINTFVSEMATKSKKKKNVKLLYFKNRAEVTKQVYKTHCIGWAICILFSLIYTLTRENSGFIEKISVQDGDGLTSDVKMVRLNIAFLPIIGLEFVIPVVYRFCESWSNAVMQELFK